MIDEMLKEEATKAIFGAILSLVLLISAVVLIGIGINWYAGFGVAAAMLYINSTRG